MARQVIVRRAATKSKFDKTRRRFKGSVILPRVVEAFLARRLETYDWIKQTPTPELRDMFRGFQFYTTPFHHQYVCLAISTTQPSFLFLLDMGAGKTKLVLDTYAYRKQHDGIRRVLIVVPGATNTEGWADEIKLHRPDLKYVQLIGGQAKRLSLLEKDVDVYLINYDGLMSYMTTLGNKSTKSGRHLDYKAADIFASMFQMVVFDEVHNVSTKSSLRFRMCDRLARAARYVYGLTGTPFGRNPEKLFTQFYLVDAGETLGPTLGLYRAAFFKEKEGIFGTISYKFDREKEQQLHSVIKNKSIRYIDSEFSDMPPIVYTRHPLTFGTDAQEYYKTVLEEIKRNRKVKELDSSWLRMRQICGGFLSVRNVQTDEETGEDVVGDKLLVDFYTNPKIEELETILDSLPDGEKMMIWHVYVRSGDLIEALLKRKGIKFSRLGGGVKDAIAQKNAFERNPAVRVQIVNVKAGNAGLNPQYVCRRGLFYETPSEPDVRMQCVKRLQRTGQKHRVYIGDLFIKGTLEEQIVFSAIKGIDLFQAICNGDFKL